MEGKEKSTDKLKFCEILLFYGTVQMPSLLRVFCPATLKVSQWAVKYTK